MFWEWQKLKTSSSNARQMGNTTTKVQKEIGSTMRLVLKLREIFFSKFSFTRLNINKILFHLRNQFTLLGWQHSNSPCILPVHCVADSRFFLSTFGLHNVAWSRMSHKSTTPCKQNNEKLNVPQIIKPQINLWTRCTATLTGKTN